MNKERLLKIKALAERGVGGEQANAAKILQEKLLEMNLTEEELNDIERSPYAFKVDAKYRQLFIQICGMLFGKDVRPYYYKGSERKQVINLTLLEFIQLDFYFDFYKKDYTEALKDFETSYIMANKLYADTGAKSISELSKEEIERHFRASKLALGINPKSPRKQIY